MNKTQLIAALQLANPSVVYASDPQLVEGGPVARHAIWIAEEKGAGASLTRSRRRLFMVVLDDGGQGEDAAWETSPFPTRSDLEKKIDAFIKSVVGTNGILGIKVDSGSADDGDYSRKVIIRREVAGKFMEATRLAVVKADSIVLLEA